MSLLNTNNNPYTKAIQFAQYQDHQKKSLGPNFGVDFTHLGYYKAYQGLGVDNGFNNVLQASSNLHGIKITGIKRDDIREALLNQNHNDVASQRSHNLPLSGSTTLLNEGYALNNLAATQGIRQSRGTRPMWNN
jgi:hypothetical protein